VVSGCVGVPVSTADWRWTPPVDPCHNLLRLSDATNDMKALRLSLFYASSSMATSPICLSSHRATANMPLHHRLSEGDGGCNPFHHLSLQLQGYYQFQLLKCIETSYPDLTNEYPSQVYLANSLYTRIKEA
jgi:hypothetical protein